MFSFKFWAATLALVATLGTAQAAPMVYTFEVNASDNEAVRASCVEFVLAGLYSLDKISRAQKHGKVHYEV